MMMEGSQFILILKTLVTCGIIMNDLKEEQTPQKKKFNWGRFWFWMISLLIIGILIGIAIPNMIYVRVYRIPDSCSGNLRNLGIIITNYSTDHQGHYPQNLIELETLGYIETLPTCPKTGESYILQVAVVDACRAKIRAPNRKNCCQERGGTYLRRVSMLNTRG